MRLEDIYPAVLTIILVGLILGIGIYIMSEVEDELYDATTGTITNITTVGVVNTTGTYVTGYTTTDATARDCALTITSAQLVNGTIVSSGNYSTSGCLINGSTATLHYNNTAWFVTGSATYSADTEASDSVNETIDGLGDFAGWIAIIVVVIAAAVVLGIVLSSFGRRQPGV